MVKAKYKLKPLKLRLYTTSIPTLACHRCRVTNVAVDTAVCDNANENSRIFVTLDSEQQRSDENGDDDDDSGEYQHREAGCENKRTNERTDERTNQQLI
ncbi:hypothetical protein KQX54_019361 [Cotesia glomerata]|uniref:Uncharacterized protein n=1 Tax=Cotesia glomerata TaxID=32391 RepID=A0AAV7I1S9_COTGL|nr:hypothetical protein KQX54_019361 [Cotesia glomerata]